MIVHIAIGNSDDKLTQQEWAKFWGFVDMDVRKYAHSVLGAWLSSPSSQWQNAAWCIDIEIPRHVAGLRKSLSELARLFGQESIAWTPGITEFITADGAEL